MNIPWFYFDKKLKDKLSEGPQKLEPLKFSGYTVAVQSMTACDVAQLCMMFWVVMVAVIQLMVHYKFITNTCSDITLDMVRTVSDVMIIDVTSR